MLPARFTRATLRALDWLAQKTLPEDKTPPHQRIGRRGEEDAYFYLRSLGYVMVARNFRSHRNRGEIDLIGWEKNVLCFIEVKTRTAHDVKPAEAAVDAAKRRQIALASREYLRHLPASCQCRYDVISVYYGKSERHPRFELFRNVSGVA